MRGAGEASDRSPVVSPGEPGGPERDRRFREAVAAARRLDPMPTFERLAEATGTEVADLVHYALTRWVQAGSEALLALEPQALRELVAARRAGDWDKVGGMIDWLLAARDGAEHRP